MRTTTYAFVLLAVSLMLGACGDAAQKGEQAAHDLIAAWGDTTAMRQVVDRLEQEREALTWPWQRSALDRAFSRPLLAIGRDSLVQAAYIVTLSPDEFAEVKVGAMVDAFLRGESLKPLGESYEYLNIIHWLGRTLGREQVVETFDRRIDSAANALPVADQMKLYSLSCTPAVLGAALAEDAGRPDADKADIARRIELLRDLYSADDFAAFEQSYRQALKTEP
ncbi:MAG: hypothetical protein IJ632_01650 [Muribaculaceae bacterium]|nr:hypothetical protein [Muribaculaceae bacterium]